MKADYRPEIPALRSVRCSNISIPSVAASIWFMPAVTILWGILYLVYLYVTVNFPGRYLSLSGLCLSILLVAWLYPRSLLPYLRWETNDNGIVFYSLVRRCFLRWEDTVSAVVKKHWWHGTHYVVQTDSACIRVPVETFNWEANATLAASVYQHLRKYGKSDGMSLGKLAGSFWIQVPGSLPRELNENLQYYIDWQNPQSLGIWQTRTADLVIAAALGLGAVFLCLGDAFTIWFCLCGLAVGIAIALRPSAAAPKRFILHDNHFEVYTIKQMHISASWESVKSAGWGLGELWMKCEGPRLKISIPYAQDRASAELVLAIVRKLRDFDHLQPLPIPERVLQWYEGRQDEESVIV